MGDLQVPFEIHALVQDADNFNSVGHEAKENHVGTDGVLAITPTDFVAGASSPWIISDDADCCMDLYDIAVSLLDVPTISGVFPDPPQIRTSPP
jgi:hypothetical protein